jgi:hypothetical protein
MNAFVAATLLSGTETKVYSLAPSSSRLHIILVDAPRTTAEPLSTSPAAIGVSGTVA